MNKEEDVYLRSGILQEGIYRNPRKNELKEKIKQIKEIMEKKYGIPSATLAQIIFHLITHYLDNHKK